MKPRFATLKSLAPAARIVRFSRSKGFPVIALAAGLSQSAFAVDGTWANPAIVNPTLTATGTPGVYTSSTPLAVGDALMARTLVGTTGLTQNRAYYVVAVNGSDCTLSATPGGAAIATANTAGATSIPNGIVTWDAVGATNTQNAASWDTVPGGTDAIATVATNGTLTNNAVTIKNPVTIGTLNLTAPSSGGMDLNLISSNDGTSTTLSALTFATTEATAAGPSITTSAKLVRLGLGDASFSQGRLKINGTQGLTLIATGTGSIRIESVDWSGFTDGGSGMGTLTVQQGAVSPQTGNYVLGSGTGAINLAIGNANSGANLANLQLGSGQYVNVLNGTSIARISSTNTTVHTLTVGVGDGTGGDFAGIFGQNLTGAVSNLTLTKIGSGTQTISGTIVGATSRVNASGGTLVLSNSGNSYGGITSVTAGGKLAASHLANGGEPSSIGASTNAATSLELNNGTLSYTGASVTTDRGFRYSSTNGGTIEVANAATNLEFTGIPSQTAAGGQSLIKTGPGTLTLSGTVDSTHFGIIVNAGQVDLNNSAGRSITRNGVVINNGATLKLTGASTDQIQDYQVVTVNNGTFDMNGKSDAAGTLTVGDGTTNGMVRGGSGSTYTSGINDNTDPDTIFNFEMKSGSVDVSLAGLGALNKTTGGTVTLSQANTYTGATTISDGTLSVTGSLAAGSAVTVTSPGILAGNGAVAGTISGNGTISPGTGVGTLTTGDVTLAGTLAIEVDGAASDKLVSTGAIDITGASLTVTSLGDGLTQGSYVIAEGASITGPFANVSLPAGYQVTIVSGGAGQQAVLSSSAGGYDSWKSNVGNQAANLDFDNDGVANGIEYFMNTSTPGFTVSPSMVGGAVSWTNGGNIPSSAYGTQYKLQTSQTLSDWVDVPVSGLTSNTSGPKGSLTYTLPAGQGKLFVRLVVMPN